MNAFDLAIIGVIALSGLFAFARGFVREALSIVAWAGAAACTLYGFNYISGLIFRFVATPLLAQMTAGAGLFILTLIVFTILTGYIARFVQSSALSPIDRTLGLIFGLVRGVALVLLAYLVVDVGLPQNERPVWIKDAKSEPFLAKGAEMLRGALPESLQIRSATATDDARRVLDRTQEAQRAMRALSSPVAPATKSSEAAVPNYKPAERRDMDRLIENAR